MGDILIDELRIGLIQQIHTVKRNLSIWSHIASNMDFLKTQEKYLQSMYAYMQVSSQINFVLALGKLFDNPKKYRTYSIKYFFDKIEESINDFDEIIETTSTRNLLKYYCAPESLINAVDTSDPTLFPREFLNYYKSIYNSEEVQSDINSIKVVRDKIVAHVEVTDVEMYYLNFEVVIRLTKFATELVSVFGMAYHSTIWESEGFSLIEKSADDDSEFIRINIEKLKVK